VVELTFAIAVLNICLGFALAAYLGYGPPEFLESLGSLGRLRPHFRLPRRAARIPAPPSPPPEPPPAVAPPAELQAMFDAGDADELDMQPCDEPYDDDAAELMAPDAPERWDLAEKYVETSILRLNIAMMKSGLRATEIDGRLRACRGHSDRETVEDCLRLLREDCITYLAEQSEAAEKFRARIGEMGELSALGEEIEMSNLEQAAQVETTINNLEYMDFHSDPEAANHRLLEEIKNLRIARHHLRDNQEAAFLAVARYENRIDKIEKQLYTDPLTQLRNRIGLEAALCEWWRQGRQKSRPMSAALIDLDAFGGVNERHGSLLGDRILYQVGQLLQPAAGSADMLGRFAGQRFLLVMLDIGPRAAVKHVEFLRQTLEKAAFLHEGVKIKLTAGASITEVKPEDNYAAVLERLESAMKTVKPLGPNRACLHDGHRAAPIESPNLGAEERDIVI
jgi:diguanylate cyclase (GGDEF)-like protein